MAEHQMDTGRLWWPTGLPAREVVMITFNIAFKNKPKRLTCQDYDTRDPFEVELLNFEEGGFNKWARYTGARLRLARPEQRGRPLRWFLFGEE